MSALPEQQEQPEQSEEERIEAATDQAIEVCGGDLRGTIRALILANEFLEAEIEQKISHGYTRGLRPSAGN